MDVYQLSVAANFTAIPQYASLDIGLFQSHIMANVGVTTQCAYINAEGDSVKIFFYSKLSDAEKTIINNLAAIHAPDPPYIQLDTFSPQITSVTVPTFVSIGTYLWHNMTYPIRKIDIVSYMSDNATSFSIKLIYRSTNTIIAQGTFSNSTFDINSITSISYVPTQKGLIDIDVKVDGVGKKTATISDIIIWGF